MKIVVAALLKEQNYYLLLGALIGQSLEGYWEFPGET